MRTLALSSLSVRSFRNLEHVDLKLGRKLNVLFGENGQGKTNFVEAVYVLATSKSFRTAKVDQLVTIGGAVASVRGRIEEDGEARTQSVGLRKGVRSVRIDDKRPGSLADYALRTPVVVFHPGSLALSAGGGSERRKLLDRVAMYARPSSLADATAYARALRARQRVLEQRGTETQDLDGWEQLVVRHGQAVSRARQEAYEVLRQATLEAFARIGPPSLAIELLYHRGAPLDADAYRSELASHRGHDRARRSAGVGPHRDDIVIQLAGQSARETASQGQHRAIVLALKLAEIAVVTRSRGVTPLLLLDDVSSELDRARTAALFRALGREESQVLLTTTRPELIETAERDALDRRDFRVAAGRIEPL
jgi:DNA replication and repair protein RecF